MPDTLALLVGSIAGVAALLLSRIWPRGRDPLQVGMVVAVVLMWGVEMFPLPLGDNAPGGLVLAAFLGALAAGLVLIENLNQFGRVPVLFALSVTCLGIYAAVPDTEPITVVLVMLAILLLGRLLGLTAIAGHLLVMAAFGVLIVWAAGVGATGRPASMVGALGCFGVLWVLPLWRRIARRPPGMAPAQQQGVLAIHVVMVFICSRIIGLKEETGISLRLAIPVVLVGGVLAALLDGYLSNRGRKRAHWKRV